MEVPPNSMRPLSNRGGMEAMRGLPCPWKRTPEAPPVRGSGELGSQAGGMVTFKPLIVRPNAAALRRRSRRSNIPSGAARGEPQAQFGQSVRHPACRCAIIYTKGDELAGRANTI